MKEEDIIELLLRTVYAQKLILKELTLVLYPMRMRMFYRVARRYMEVLPQDNFLLLITWMLYNDGNKTPAVDGQPLVTPVTLTIIPLLKALPFVLLLKRLLPVKK
jgi:hypothetical protein